MKDIYCIGSAHVDKILTFNQVPVMGNSNHAFTQICTGGVAYNIAVVLSNLRLDVGLSSLLGADGDSQNVMSAAKSHMIDVDAIMQTNEVSTASYNAMHLPNGELLIAAADMHIYHKLTADILSAKMDILCETKAWMVDSTFLPTIQQYLAGKSHGIDVYVTICSVSEAKHIRPWLNSSTKALFANMDELAVLTDNRIDSLEDIQYSLNKLATTKVQTIFATRGANGVYVYHNNEHYHFDAYPADVKCVNGAGDSFAAATIAGLVNNLPLGQAVKHGLAAAKLRLENKDINAESINEIINQKSRVRSSLTV